MTNLTALKINLKANALYGVSITNQNIILLEL